MHGSQVARVRLRLEGDGQPLAKTWPESIRGQFDFFASTQGDGTAIDSARPGRLPSAWALLQKTSGVFANGPGSAPLWKELNRPGAEKIESRHLLEYYRASGLGEALIGAGKAGVEKPLGRALAAALDADGDGNVTEKELAAAENLLGKLDANGDELITPGELLPKAVYPGAAGTHWLRAPGPEVAQSAWNQGFPVIVLPRSRADIAWCQVLIARHDLSADEQLDTKEIAFARDAFVQLDRDRNGKLSAAELARLRDLPPDADWTITLGKSPAIAVRPRIDPTLIGPSHAGHAPTSDRLEVALAGMQWTVRADAGTLGPLWREFRERIESKFREVDSRGAGFVPAGSEKATAMSEWECVLYCADANLDGKVSETELTQWLKTNEAYSRSVATITMLDHGRGLFALLDADRDGALSLRELRRTKSRLEQVGAMDKGGLLLERIPGQFRVTIGFGPPKRLLYPKSQQGPAWFQAMDRNGDGDLSRKECPFPAEWFDRHDKDHDGLIDFQEAAAVAITQKPRPGSP